MGLNISLKLRGSFGFPILLFSTISFCFFFILNILQTEYGDMDIATWSFYIISSAGLAWLLSTTIYFLFYILPFFISKREKLAVLLYILISIIIQLILMLDYSVYGIYKFHINQNIIEMVAKGGTSMFVVSTEAYLKFGLLIFFSTVLPFCILVRVRRKVNSFFTITSKKIITIIFIGCLLLSFILYAIGLKIGNSGIKNSVASLPVAYLKPVNTLMTKWAIANVDEIDASIFLDPKWNIQNELLEFHYPKHPIAKTDSLPSYNIVYIMIDSWNPRAFNEEVTPEIYKFSQKGVFFSNHMSSSCATYGSIYGFFYGLPNIYFTKTQHNHVYPLLIDRLLELDYNIQIFPSANFKFPDFDSFIFGEVPNKNQAPSLNSSFDDDKEITRLALNYIDTISTHKPFFSFMFYDLAHAMSLPENHSRKFEPSWSAPNYSSLNNDMDPTLFFNLYKNCIHNIDAMVGAMCQKLEEKDMLKNTVIVITGDHGQEFNENEKNYWGHYGNYSEWQIKVPFILYYPGVEQGAKFSHVTTHYDVSATILSQFLGIKNDPSDYSFGFNLFDPADRYPLVLTDETYHKSAFVFDDIILDVYNEGYTIVNDKKLNTIPRHSMDVPSVKKAVEKRNQFLKAK